MTVDLAVASPQMSALPRPRPVPGYAALVQPRPLQVRVFGELHVCFDQRAIDSKAWRGQNTRRLLARLLLARGRLVLRDQLLDDLWPGAPPESAENNLRVTLSRLHKALEPAGSAGRFIVQDGDGLRCQMHLIDLDLQRFDDALLAGQQAQRLRDQTGRVAALEQILDHYGGPLLPECHYDDWSTLERERCLQSFCMAALEIARMEQHTCPDRAAALAWRVLAADATHEAAYQLLMRLKWAAGDRSTALRLYKQCRHALKAELNVEPLAETEALARQIGCTVHSTVLETFR